MFPINTPYNPFVNTYLQHCGATFFGFFSKNHIYIYIFIYFSDIGACMTPVNDLSSP